MNPLISIWFSIRKTCRYLIDNYDAKTVWLLAIMEGIKESFNWAYTCNMGRRHGVEFIEILVLLVGPPLGIFGNWVSAFFASWIGRQFGGKGSTQDLLTVLVWGNLPVIILVPFWFLLILGFGDNAFSPNMSVMAIKSGNPQLISLNYGFLFLKMAAAIWAFIIMLVGVSEAHGFSKWNAFANIFVAALATYAIFGLPIYFIFRL